MIKQKRPLNKKLLLLGGIGIAIVAIIVILLFAFIGRKDPYTGTWIGVKIEAEGVLLDTREAFDDDIFIDINDDGMCVLTSGDEKVNGEWEKEKGGILIKADGFTLHCRVKGNTMIIENYADSGMTLTLEKVSGSAGKTSAQLNDPNAGVWHVVSAEIWGIKTDIRDVFENGFSVELLEKGKCKLNVNGIIADGQWTLKDGVITIKGGGLDTSGTLRDGLLFLENVMGIGLDLSFRKDGIPEDTEIADGGFQSPTTTIDEDSYWYGMVILSNIVPAVDANEMEGPHDVWGYVGTDSGGRAFFEVYDTPHMDEFPILSTYIDLYSDSFAADIGYEDAWLFDDYLDASANVFFSPGLDNGALNISYYFQGEDLSFDFTLFLREDGAPWDMENDTLPPGYDNYYGLSGEDGDWDEEELMPAEFLTMAQLREAYDFMEPSGMTYEEVRDLFLGGVDGEVVPKDDPDLKGYVWRSQEDPAKAMWITYKKNSAGKYVYTSRSIQGVP